MKGRAEPVAAWRLVGPRAVAQAPAKAPLVGREAEVERLRAAVGELTAGRGQILSLVGEAGLGKTRLLNELQTIAAGSVTWLEGQCPSYGGGLLYWPFVEMLRGWLGVEEGLAEVAVRTRLRAKLAASLQDRLNEVLPYLARLLSLRIDPDDEKRLQDLPPETLAAEVRAAYRAWIEALTRAGPVVLAIEDAQWADPSTRELAEDLLELTDRAPLLLATTARVEPGSEGWRFRLRVLADYGHRAVELQLGPLSEAAAEELLSMLLPGLDDTAKREIAERAEGNPLYLQELLRALVEGGGLERRRTWTLTVKAAELLPPALENLLVARIDRLPEGARRLAQLAAVVGRTFPVRVLEHVAGNGNLEDDLAVLLRAEIVREVGRYPELQCTFTHGLLQEAARSTLTPARRQELCGRVAAAYEELFASSLGDYLELLAHLYAGSKNLSKALSYLERAGQKAADLRANAQARELWGRARKVAVRLGDGGAERRIAECLAGLESPEPHKAPQPGVGDRLGPYRLEAILGEGAIGIVFRAVREPDGETVALKVLRPELSGDETYRRRFLHEARVAGEVKHKHLVPVLEAGEADGRHYIAVGYVRGRTLGDRIEAEGPLQLHDLLRLVAEVAAGLHAVHRRGLVHRDVKPSNVMLDERGDAALTDFGLATGPAYTVLTKTGQVVGTLDYLAPELIRGKPAGPPSDIYALGCVVFECIAGGPPFAGRGLFEVGTAHLEEDPRAGRPELPPGLSWAALQALAKDPAQRPPTATAYAHMLQVAAKADG